MSDKKWITFWFEGNAAWGIIDSRKEFEWIKKQYNGSDCRSAKRAGGGYERNGTPYVGYRAECKGPETLGSWADKNGIEL